MVQPAPIAHQSGCDSPPEQPERFAFVDSAQFLTAKYEQRFLVTGALVAGQPGVVAGPSKAMKTSLVIDMAVSLATGSAFLGKFGVPSAARVGVVSGESGQATLQETCKRVLAAKMLDPRAVADRLKWCFDLPQFRDLDQMDEFAEGLKALAVDVVFLDPVYLCMGGDIEHGNVFAMGPAFRVVADVLLKGGVTPILVHHANRQLRTGEPMEIQHLAYSGLEQFARQFVLLNRRTPYKGDGVHDLWLSACGSAGHGGLWSLNIEEGTVDERFAGRKWDVAVRTEAQAAAVESERREKEKTERERKKYQQEETDLLAAIDTAARLGKPCTKTFVRTQFPRLKGGLLDDVAERLIRSGEIVSGECQTEGGCGSRQQATAYKRASQKER